ncbi:PKD-like family lipoprotein [Proteiniphilum sp. UBA5384]|uniref:PKD-like family lipoprotein n=1 Tax=Proteiniphilum sp. UBA5384 TaxID=1947279 RepID=UPI0025D9BDDD|nr:PKD-like family lipoprotein [Proteiniphilum sp. UBA5384]
MKITHLLYSLLLTILSFSCVNDLGNYDYLPAEEVMGIGISGIKDTTVVIGDELVIKPILKNMDDESRYEYLWYAVRQLAGGFLPTRDTLAQTRDLSAVIQMEANDYYLVYIIRDPATDLFVSEQVEMKVQGSKIGAGWYILKEIDNETDFDYINPNEDPILEIPNVLRTQATRQDFIDAPATVGDLQLKGKPRQISYQGGRYMHEFFRQDGSIAQTLSGQAIHIISDQEIKTFNASNFYLFKDINNFFYGMPETVQPQKIYGDAFGDVYFLNAGKLYTIYGMSGNIGKFGYYKTADDIPNYKLFGEIVPAIMGAMVFDMETNSFLVGTSSGNTLNFLEDQGAALSPSRNMNYKLAHLLQRGAFFIDCYVILQDKNDPQQYYLAYGQSYMGEASNPFVSFREIPKSAQMPTADVFGLPGAGRSIYFAKGNILNVYIDAENPEKREIEVYRFPDGETISYITRPNSNTLAILTNSSNGWKLYGFKPVGSSWEIETEEPTFVYTGEGRGHSVILR